MMLIYKVKRTDSCYAEQLERACNKLAEDGYTVVSVIVHSSQAGNGGHDGRSCVLDILSVKERN